MEEDIENGPFTVWRMFNDPTMVLFNNLEHAEDGLEILLTSILKLSGDSCEVLVARPGSSKFPDSYYKAFNTWFIGRLFYLWSVKELDRIHMSSKKAQLKILSILSLNKASFYDELHFEYFYIFKKLTQYYTNNFEGELLLENFAAEQIEVPHVQLNLTPIFVNVKDENTCITLMKLTLQLLSESIPQNSLRIERIKTECEMLFTEILYVLGNFSFDLKLVSLKFFAKLIRHNNKEEVICKFRDKFPYIYKEILYSLEATVRLINMFHNNGEFDFPDLDIFNKVVIDLIQFFQKDNDCKAILLIICNVILKEEKLFSKLLKLQCLSLSTLLDFPSNIILIEQMDHQEINMVKDYYTKNILCYMRDNMKCDKTFNFKDNTCYNQVINVLDTLKSCEAENVDSIILRHHLERVNVVLHILQGVYVLSRKEYKPGYPLPQILENNIIKCMWGSLLKIVQCKETLILQDCNNLKLCMEITISSITFLQEVTKDESIMLLKLLYIKNNAQFHEQTIESGEVIGILVLKYILIAKIILKKESNEAWNKIIMGLVNTFVTKEKSLKYYKHILPICPLLLLNKILSPSKITEEILMPIFIRKDHDIHIYLFHIMPAFVCMSLSTFSVIVNAPEDVIGHSIFNNGSVDICVVCKKCHNLERNGITSNNVELLSENDSRNNTSVNIDMNNFFSKFLNQQCYNNIDKIEYWALFTTLCNHYYVFAKGVSTEIANENNNFKYILKALHPFMDYKLGNDDKEFNDHSDAAYNLCINYLQNSTQRMIQQSNDYNTHNSLLNDIKTFGCFHNEKVLLPATKLLVYFIMLPQCGLRPKAVVFLKDICDAHNFTPNQVYHRYKKDYCEQFVSCSLYNGKEFSIALRRVVSAFGFVGYRDFISKDVHHFLPYLIPYSVTVKQVPQMIEEIASLVQCSVSDFLTERFPHTYVHIDLNESREVAEKCYALIESLTKMNITNLIKIHYRVILTEFLLNYCSCPEKVLNACRHLAGLDPDLTAPRSNTSMNTRQIADFLNPKFLGVLAYFDHKLVHAKVALAVKRKVLKSLSDIMQLMGVKYMTQLRYKVLVTLRSALTLVKEFPEILAEAWSAFIHNIDTMALGPMLPNFAVSLLQQIEYAPQEINEVFSYIVLNNENLLSSHLSDLFFLEDSKVSVKVKVVIDRHVKRTRPDKFIDKIGWYLRHMNQEIPKIKAYAFSHLNKLLKENRAEIHKAIFGGKNIDPVLAELIDCLLLGCNDSDPEVSAASGSCLGQLGAVEAALLPRQYVQPDRSPFAFSIADDCFAATALLELTRAFQYEEDTTNMDCYALTIQEILKVYNISPTGDKRRIWDSFPEHIHQIMQPLLSSRYALAYPCQPKKTHPLYGSTHATTFLEWAHNWASQLIPLIESPSIRELLLTVYPSMRRDVRTLFLFLPYVLLHAVMANTNHIFIQEEMLAVIGVEDDENISTSEKCRLQMLRQLRSSTTSSVQAEDSNQSKCSTTVYTLLDFLNRWLLEWFNSKPRPLESANYKAISSFVNKFDKLSIARGNFKCGHLERALQYLEVYMHENKQDMQKQLPLLAEIYALLDEPDSITGILSIKQSEPSLKELILAHVVTGRLHDAALCYERLAQQGPLDRYSLKGMVDCYLGIDQPFTAYRLLSEQEDSSMAEMAAEALWRLGRFEQLEELAEKPVPASKENWGLMMGRILLTYRKEQHDAFETTCNDAVNRLLIHMHTDSKGESALRSGYQSVMGLHIVSEAQHAEELLRKLKSFSDHNPNSLIILNQLLEEWRLRLSLVQPDFRTVEPLLRTRRILLTQTKKLLEPTHPQISERINYFIGDLWLQSAKHARKAGIFQQAYKYILNAEEYRPEQLFIEKAKMYWARGQREAAFTTLRRALQDAYPPQAMDRLNLQQRKICAKAKLLIAKYNDETTNVDVDVNISNYKDAVDVFKNWEKSLVCLGSYYEKVSTLEASGGSTSEMWSRRLLALEHYGRALQCGHKYLYQSMPMMLSIWLDVEVTLEDKSVLPFLAKMTEMIRAFSERLPLYLYLTAFSQIVSRICHPVKDVYLQLKAIIVKLIVAYPQHTLWNMMSVIKSGYPQRIKRCADVLSDPLLQEPVMRKLVHDFTQLAEKLIELCNKPLDSITSTTVSAMIPALPRLLKSNNFSRIMVPFQEFCKVVLPSKAARQERLDFHVPPEPPVYITAIDEAVTILASMQRPRKVNLKGSDGKLYTIMLKPRDDLRKDYRLMEFNTVVNRFLQDAPETRRRRLYIRTYSVLPLNEECGLIEWVPNLVGLRPILLHIYKQKGILTPNRELKELMCGNKEPIAKKLQIYEEQLLPRYPPVFQEWFRQVFSDPYGWYQARSAYIRTAAVMSMVGYILGLGDRHGENILFDATNGDVVHVDFNCLFNKGETFEWPERVPFRLTHNMEAAMGPLLHEGMFRKCCEAVMHAMRAQTAALMSVVGPFVYDPLVSWAREKPPRGARIAEQTNAQAVQSLRHIRQRLNGMVKTKNKQLSVFLSPEGQVDQLIDEATSKINLCQMYIGWGPFL